MIPNFDDVEPGVDPDAEFWHQRDVLLHVRDFARSRMVSPWATLAYVLREGVACIRPDVVLPPIVGGYASVNLNTAGLGRSGQGKDAANEAGRAAVTFKPAATNIPLKPNYPHPGSGEGLARIFKGHTPDNASEGDEDKIADKVTNAHLVVNEVGTLEALVKRQGATLGAELLKANMGQPLGFKNNRKDTSTEVEAHSYRLCIGIGVQPENAGFFLERAKDGFPQRFLFLPTDDPQAPPPELLPPEPEPYVVELPVEAVNPYNHQTAQFKIVDVPEAARDEIRQHRHRVLVGDPNVNPLDGHLLLTRLKIAFALAVLDGRIDINVDDWKLADDLLIVSAATRSEMASAVADRRARENRARALADDERDEVRSDRKVERTKASILRSLSAAAGGPVLRRDVRRRLKADIRDNFDAAVAQLVDSHQISELTVGNAAALQGHQGHRKDNAE